jgi:hypothetical protein
MQVLSTAETSARVSRGFLVNMCVFRWWKRFGGRSVQAGEGGVLTLDARPHSGQGAVVARPSRE